MPLKYWEDFRTALKTMSNKIRINISENGKSLEEVLRGRGISRRLITRLKRTEGGITRSGQLIRTIDKVSEGDEILLSESDSKLLIPNGKLSVPILYDDDWLVVFNKPPFMPVHPSINHQDDTLGNFFAYMFPNLTFRPVNRLDRDTSGCVIAAKNQFSAQKLQKSYEKVYFGICCGVFEQDRGMVNAPIAREKESIIKRCVRDDGQQAVTHYEVIKQGSQYAFVKFLLENGRTHQIRVHMSHIGHPIAGDSMYGGECKDFSRQALHCGKVIISHPETNKKLEIY
ncbi:MAG: RluA family pseudouridine synthase, partial [Oscillospiraceae bacterium]